MLQLTDGGRCMSGPDAIEFLERLADMLDEDVKTDDFCDEFTWALNRCRFEIRKSVPVPPKKDPGRTICYSCGQCGHILQPRDNYCSLCGRMIGKPFY